MSIVVTSVLNDLTGMRFVARTASGHEVVMDALPEVGGTDTGPRPGELPLVGLSACTGMDVISILRKMRQPVTSFSVEVEGIHKATEHPKRWTELRVIFHLTGEVDRVKLERAIDLSRTQYCSVAAMLKPQTTIHYRYVLNGDLVDLPPAPEPAHP
ncbi:MAG: OsmC family protein [Myxococcota bacterium]|jgi:putative redox protein|nr:OsmC family protein [Myxococcota bacterium]